MELQVSDLEKDIIKEILNIGLARAADSFAVIAKDIVLLKVPDLQLTDPKEILKLVSDYETTHVIIQSDIKGDFNGSTLMLFSGHQIEHLSRVCLRIEAKFDGQMTDMQESLLLEISNIITGALVTQLANILKANIYGSPPMAPKGNIAESLTEIIDHHPLFQPMVFTVLTQFTNYSQRVELPLMIFFDTNTFIKVLDIIRAYNFLEENKKELF